MMEEQPRDLQDLWDQLLSGDADAVRVAFRTLGDSERKAVLEHLQRMTSEEGWQPEQVTSARAALQALLD